METFQMKIYFTRFSQGKNKTFAPTNWWRSFQILLIKNWDLIVLHIWKARILRNFRKLHTNIGFIQCTPLPQQLQHAPNIEANINYNPCTWRWRHHIMLMWIDIKFVWIIISQYLHVALNHHSNVCVCVGLIPLTIWQIIDFLPAPLTRHHHESFPNQHINTIVKTLTQFQPIQRTDERKKTFVRTIRWQLVEFNIKIWR